jgi:8-oxo-dGTP pyrophosphatase MutT (NUDIX family)
VKLQQSAGGVIIAKLTDGQHYLALVRGDDGRWRLPKGHVEQGEDLEAAALREIQEETALNPDKLMVRRYLGSYALNEHSRSRKGEKLNHFFLVHLISDRLPSLMTDPAHVDAAWWRLPLDRSVALAYPPQERLIRHCMETEFAG